MALTLTFNQPGIPAGDLDRGRTDILTTDAGGGRSPLVSIEIGDVPPGSVVLVQAIDEPPSSSPMLTQMSDTLWTLDWNAGAWGPFRIQATASIGTEVVSSVTRRISVRSPTFHLAYPALSERYDPNAHLVPTVPSVQLTEMNEHSTNRALVDFHREVVQAIDTLSAGGIDSIPDGSITEAKLDPALVAQLVLTDGSHAMVGALDMSGSRIVDLGQPTLPTDAARFVDADYTAGAGLVRTGQTLDVVAHADGSILAGTDSVQVGVLATDAQHGTRGGGTQHATVTTSSPGFSSPADKLKLDGIAAGADVTIAALAAAAVPVSVNGQRIINLGAPIAATDAVRVQDLTAAAVVAGAGLVRAGATLDVVAHADGSIVVAPDSVQVGVLATDVQHGARGGGTQHATVTTSSPGFSSPADKLKLDGIAAGADVTIAALAAAAVPVSVNAKRITNLATPTAATDAATRAYVDAAPPVPHSSTHADGGSDELTVAGLSGLLADPQTAGGIKTATTTVAVAAAAAPAADQALMANSSTAAAWRVPPVATTSLPGYLSAADKLKLDGLATSAAAVGSTAASQITVTTAGPGAAATAARSDHVHSVATAAPSGLTVGGAQNAGTSTSLVRADHVHAMPALVTTTVDGFMAAGDKTRLDGMASAAAAVGSTAASQITVATAASGAATTAARSDHVHSVATAAPSALTVGGAQNAGTSVSLARADHVHAMPAAGTPVALTLAGANAPGSAATLALSDHVHALPATTAPAALTVGGSSSAGVAVTLPRADHVHAMPGLATGAADGFMAQGDFSKLAAIEAGAQVVTFARVQTALAAASAAVSFNAQRLSSVADPSAPQDVATKAYTDAIAQGLDVKASVRLVATSNVAALTGNVSIDGSTTAPGQRVLLAGQTTASANGPYLTAAGAWARTTDADTSAKVTAGMYVFATEGTANADSGWALITPDPIVLGTTALTFTQVTGAGQITAGAGLTKAGNTLDVVAHADASIVVAADSVQVGVLATDAQHGTRGGGTLHAAVVAAGASGFMTGADKTRLDGIATGAAAVGSTTPIAADVTAAAVGAAATAARSDHRHQVTAGSPVALTLAGTTADGTSTSLVRADHVHALPATAAPAALTVGAASSAGVAVTLPRSDHVHAMPGIATTSVDGFLSAASKARIDGANLITCKWHAPNAGSLALSGIPVGWQETPVAGDRVLAWGLTTAANDGVWVIAAGAWTRAPEAAATMTLAEGTVISTHLASTAANAADGDQLLFQLAQPWVPGTASLSLVPLYGNLRSSDGSINVAGRNITATSGPTRSYFDVRLATASVLPAYTATAISTNQPRLTAVANGALSIDGVVVAPSDLVLVLFETAANCGVYRVVNAGGASAKYQLDLAYSGAFTASPNGSQMVVRTSGDGYAYCNREFRPASSSTALFVEIPGQMQIWPQGTVAPTTIYPGWFYELEQIAGSSPSLTLISPAGSAQVLSGVQFGVSLGNLFDASNTVTITPTGLSSITMPGTPGGGNSNPTITFKMLAGSSAVWVCGNGNASYNPDSPFWRGFHGANLPASALNPNIPASIPSASPAVGDVLTAVSATQLNWQQPTLVDPATNGFRLSDTVNDSGHVNSGTLTTVYLAPDKSDRMALYSNGSWGIYTASGVSYVLSGRTAPIPFDLFAFYNGGATPIALEALNWSTTTARATALAKQNGVWTKSGDPTRRYLGTVRPRSATTYRLFTGAFLDDVTPIACDIWNVDNRKPLALLILGPASSYTYTSTTVRQLAANANAQIEVITGIGGDEGGSTTRVIAIGSASSTNATAVKVRMGIGVNTTTSSSARTGEASVGTAIPAALLTAELTWHPPLGTMTYVWLESGNAGVTMAGTGGGGSGPSVPAMDALVWY